MLGEIKCYDLGYADVFVFDHYLINQIKNEVHVTLEHVEVLRQMIDQNFHDRKLVYISNRVGSYSVDPLVYPEVARIKNLLGMAIVTDKDENKKNAAFEKVFYHKEFRIFETLEESIIWAAGVLAQANLRKIAG